MWFYILGYVISVIIFIKTDVITHKINKVGRITLVFVFSIFSWVIVAFSIMIYFEQKNYKK